MPVHNADIAAAFEEIAELLELADENPFRIRAYRNAARVVEGLSLDLAAHLAAGKDPPKLPGIGGDLAGKIRELAATGSCKLLLAERPDSMNAPSRSTQDPFLRTSIVATVISMVCISILAIGFLFENSSSEGILLLLVPFTCHIVALFLLLNQPDTSSITASIWVGALGIVFTVPFAVIGVSAGIDWIAAWARYPPLPTATEPRRMSATGRQRPLAVVTPSPALPRPTRKLPAAARISRVRQPG